MDDTSLIQGRWVVPAAATGDAVLSDGALILEGATIQQLGTASAPADRYS